MDLERYANVLTGLNTRIPGIKAERNALSRTTGLRLRGRQYPYQDNADHLPPTSPSIGLNVALYAIFGLSRIQ
jgi:hypothetical protein